MSKQWERDENNDKKWRFVDPEKLKKEWELFNIPTNPPEGLDDVSKTLREALFDSVKIPQDVFDDKPKFTSYKTPLKFTVDPEELKKAADRMKTFSDDFTKRMREEVKWDNLDPDPEEAKRIRGILNEAGRSFRDNPHLDSDDIRRMKESFNEYDMPYSKFINGEPPKRWAGVDFSDDFMERLRKEAERRGRPPGGFSFGETVDILNSLKKPKISIQYLHPSEIGDNCEHELHISEGSIYSRGTIYCRKCKKPFRKAYGI